MAVKSQLAEALYAFV